jgi:hypothetical protein
MQRPGTLLMTISVFAFTLCGQTPQPHAGWKLVPGGENLISNGYWDTFEEASAPAQSPSGVTIAIK